MKKRWVGLASLLAGGALMYLQNRKVVTSEYTLPIADLPSDLSQFKIVQLSDIHFPNVVLDVDYLLRQVADSQPDIIVITGNLVTAKEAYDRKEMTQFIQQLVSIAPTYVVSGDQEYKMKHLVKLKEDIIEGNGHYLENDVIWVPKGESGILLMGLDESSVQETKTSDYLKHLVIPEEYLYDVKILLAHHPEKFLYYHTDLEKLPDVTLTGHAKGGYVRMPLLGGVFAKNQGVLPEYTSGVYAHPLLPEKLLVVSRGIGAPKLPTRLNNKPEMIVATLVKR